MSLCSDTQSPVMPAGRSGSSAERSTNLRNNDGLTAKTVSESRYSLCSSNRCVTTVRKPGARTMAWMCAGRHG
jgi:hypothetical protein